MQNFLIQEPIPAAIHIRMGRHRMGRDRAAIRAGHRTDRHRLVNLQQNKFTVI